MLQGSQGRNGPVIANIQAVFCHFGKWHDIEVEDDVPATGKSVWGSGHKALIADFYRHVEAGKKFPIGGAEGAKSVRIILKMYESNGKKLEV